MKKNSVFESPHCTWVDIENPTESDLEALSKEYQIPFHALKDCLQADHLPKYEELDGIHFLILRLMDDQAATMAKSIQGLTRKVAIFQKTDFVLTIHRSEMKIWTDFKEKKRKNAQSPSTDWLVSQMMKCVFHSFEPFLFRNLRRTLKMLTKRGIEFIFLRMTSPHYLSGRRLRYEF